jgi:hypothetical protein
MPLRTNAASCGKSNSWERSQISQGVAFVLVFSLTQLVDYSLRSPCENSFVLLRDYSSRLTLFRNDSAPVDMTFWNLATELMEDRKGWNAMRLGANLPGQHRPQLGKFERSCPRQRHANPLSQSVRLILLQPIPTGVARQPAKTRYVLNHCEGQFHSRLGSAGNSLGD